MAKGKGLASLYLELVCRVPCVNCEVLGRKQETPTAAHHPREGVGMAQRSGDFCTCALCWDCHQGPMGIHGDRTYKRMAKLTEWEMHDMTNEAVFKLAILEVQARAYNRFGPGWRKYDCQRTLFGADRAPRMSVRSIGIILT